MFWNTRFRLVDSVEVAGLDNQGPGLALMCLMDGQATESTWILGTKYAVLGCAEEEYGVGDL